MLLPPPDAAASRRSRFLAEVCFLMGLPKGAKKSASRKISFRGRNGFLCRVAMDLSSSVPAARPEIILPFMARELVGLDIERLLVLQMELARELGWILGIAIEGQVQLSTVGAIESPEAVVAAVDTGQALCLLVIDELTSSLR